MQTERGASAMTDYPDARPTRCASDSMQEGVGVCRDFAKSISTAAGT
jgi:hypothetical protein